MEQLVKEEVIQFILEQVGAGIQIVNEGGRIIYYNQAAGELDNVDCREAVGRHVLEIFPSLTEETSTVLQVLKTGRPLLNIQQTFVNYLGHRITTINSSYPLKALGRIIGALEVSRNITAVRELTEKVAELQKQLYYEETKTEKPKKGTAAYTLVDLIGQSDTMQRLKLQALKAAESQSPILVYGSTGTGKELLVQSIHNASRRRNRPFIAQNCAAIPVTLLESILFGTVRGSFSGAEDRPGLLELASGGTLFLDEVQSMPWELQSKLLRVLEESAIRRIGDGRLRPIDMRIVAAMNCDPLEAVEQKWLRQDLFYRLTVVSLKVPDLKERREDLPELVQHFISKYNRLLGKQVQGLAEPVWHLFYHHHWPGNVRELEHVIEGAMNLLEGNTIHLKDLPFHLVEARRRAEAAWPAGSSLKAYLQQAERQAIKEALDRAGGNVSLAAKSLGIPRQTLQYKLKIYGLQGNQKEESPKPLVY